MATCAFSLVLPSLNPKTLSLCNPKPNSVFLLSLSSLSHKLNANPISISPLLTSSSRCYQRLSSRFVRNVAVSSDYDQDEEELSDDGEGSFSEDLKLFVGNLPFTADSAQLAGLFETAGNVQMVEVIYDKATGRSRGFGFVTMSSIEEVQAAANQFNGYELDGRPLRVNFGPPPKKDDSFSRAPRSSQSFGDNFSRGPPRGGSSFGSSKRVYVGNLSWGVDDYALETLFSEQGKVVEAKVVYDRESGRSRGFGFVSYNSDEEVNNAVESLNGVALDGRPIRVSVAEARPPRRQF